MRRLLPLVLPLLAGCGGHSGGSASLPHYPALEAASIDLVFSGSASPPATLKATGAARGEVTIVSPTGDGHATEVTALVQGETKNGERVDRRVVLALNDPATLHAGATYALDAAKNQAAYSEGTLHLTGPQAGLLIWGDTGASPGGTVTVVSLDGGVAILRLTDVAFPFPEGTSTAYVLSGTITGRVVAAIDMG